MVHTPTNLQVTVPIYTKVGGQIDSAVLRKLGLVHLGDATIEVPVQFDVPLPIDDPGGWGQTPYAEKCTQHAPVQHRDGKPPWCNECGLTADFTEPVSRFTRQSGGGVTIPGGDAPAPTPEQP